MLDIHTQVICSWICQLNNNNYLKNISIIQLIAMLILLTMPLAFIDSICFLPQIQI